MSDVFKKNKYLTKEVVQVNETVRLIYMSPPLNDWHYKSLWEEHISSSAYDI